MTTLTGTLTVNGNLVTGTLYLELSQQATAAGGVVVSPSAPSVFSLVNGAIAGPGAGPYTVYGNDVLTPANTFYYLTVFGSQGEQLLRGKVSITGASQDIGAFASASPHVWVPPTGYQIALTGDANGPSTANTVTGIHGKSILGLPWTPGDVLTVQADQSLEFEPPPSTWGGVAVSKSGILVGTRWGLNLIPGAGVTLTVVDDAVDGEVEVTIAAAGGGHVTGSGTDTYIPQWDGTGSVLKDSSLSDDGSLISTPLRIESLTMRVGAADSGPLGYGRSALKAATDGLYSVAVGNLALSLAGAGRYITALGFEAGGHSTAANGSVFVGWHAGYNATAGDSVFVGHNAAGYGIVTGLSNIGVGSSALANLTGGTKNVTVAYQGLSNVTTGSRNVGIACTLLQLTTGSNVIGIGDECLRRSTASGSVAVGVNAFWNAIAATGLVGVGYKAGYLAEGNNATLLGYEAGYNTGAVASTANALTSGTDATFLGFRAGLGSATQRSNVTALGSGAYVDASNRVVLGNASVVDVWAGSTGGATLIGGGLGVGTQSPWATADVRGNLFVGPGAPAATPRSTVEITRTLASIAVGYGAALRVNSGAEPDYGTPGADTNVGVQVFANNAANADHNLWGLNIVVGQGAAPIAAPTPPANGIHVVGLEFEVFNRSDAGNAQLDPIGSYANKIRANGLEIIGHSGSTYRNAGGIAIWANDSTGVKWWDTGVAISRSYSYGVRFQKVAGDSVEPFQTALFDASSLGTATQTLLLARSGGDVWYDIKNAADYALYVNIDSGATVGEEAALLFSDQGARKWLIGKDSANKLQIGWNDGATPLSAISAYVDSEVTPTAVLLSFFGATPAAKPTASGSRGGNAALASLLTALATLGLLTDSTT